MRFACDNCQAKYSIADDRVENKVVKLGCQKCGHEITVRGPVTKPAAAEQKKAGDATLSQIQSITRSQPVASVPESFDFGDEDDEPRESTRIANLSELERMRQAALQEATTGPKKVAATAPMPPSSPPPPQVKGVWMVLINNEQKGPFTPDEVKAQVTRNEINLRSYVWREGMAEWARLQTVQELASSEPGAPKAPPAPPKQAAHKALAVADLVDPRIQGGESTKPAFDTRAMARRKIEPAATAPAEGDFDSLFGPQSTGTPPPVKPQPEPVSGPVMMSPDAPPREQTESVIAAAGLVQRKKNQRLYLLASAGTLMLLLLLLVLDLSGVITIPGFGFAYNLVGIDNPHQTDPGAPQFSDNLTDEERRRIREGLLGKKKPDGTAPTPAPAPAPTPAPTDDTAPPAPKAEDKLLNEVYSDDTKLAVTIEAPKLRLPEQDLPKGLDSAAIGKVVQANQAAVKSCYEKSLKRGIQVGGRLEVEFSIINNGNVGAAEVKSAKHKGTDFAGCITGAVKGWKFPRFVGDPVTVEYPFILSTGN